MIDLFSLFLNLKEIKDSGEFYSALVLPGHPNIHIAKDSYGNPALLFSTKSHSNELSIPPREFKYFSFRPSCMCQIINNDGTIASERLTMIKCSKADQILREYFLRALSGIISLMPLESKDIDILLIISNLIELFRSMEAPPLSSIEGIWCELFLIANAHDINLAATAWHADPNELFDFVNGEQQLEVKSTKGPIRIHNFNLDQLIPKKNNRILIVSFLIDEKANGLSIIDLWEKITSRMDISERLKERISQIITMSLGRDWRDAIRIRFDSSNALNTISIYDAIEIPQITSNIPAEVSDVRFKSELTDILPLSKMEIVELGGLYKAIFG